MDSKKLINEDITRMKSLFGYQRGRVISEQEFNEDVIGSYERAELNKIDPGTEHRTADDIAAANKKQAELDAKYNVASTTGWFDKFPILMAFLKDTSYFKVIHYPTVRNKDTGLLAAQRTGENEKYYYGFMPDGKFYISDGWDNLLARKAVSDTWTGTWKVDGTNLIINTADGDSFTSATKKWKSDTNKKSGGGGSTSSVTPTPPELKDIKGVKAFQDWLDENKAGWATGYANNILNKTGAGYGRMGPRTTKAWASYKDEYLKGGQTQNNNPYSDYTAVEDSGNTTKQGVEGDNDTTQPAPQQAQQSAQQAPEQTTQKSPQPPTGTGEPGEQRDGWTFDEKRQTWY
jgi:hypothetical protein